MPAGDTSDSIKQTETLVLALTAVLSLLCVPIAGTHVAAGAGIGGIAAYLNLWMLRTLVRGFLGEGFTPAEMTTGRKLALGALALVKLAFVYGGLFWLVTQTPVSRIGIMIGFAALPLGIVAHGLRAQVRELPGIGRDEGRAEQHR